MRWILNCLPLIATCIIEVPSVLQFFYGVKPEYNPLLSMLMLLEILVISPVYLLFVNAVFIKKKKVPYVISILSIFGVILGKVVIISIANKIKSGMFFGDLALEFDMLFIGVPIIIIAVGLSIMWVIDSIKGVKK